MPAALSLDVRGARNPRGLRTQGQPARSEGYVEDSCVYCRGSAADAIGREHVLPESLGNPDWMLPLGFVCDPCNNRLGSVVDAPFTSAGVGALRMMLGVPGKRGASTWQLPRHTKLRLSDENGPATFSVRTVAGTPNRAVPRVELGDPVARWSVDLPTAPSDRVSAFLSKLLLATVAAHLGRDAALVPDLDPHRANLHRPRAQGTPIPWHMAPVPGGEGLTPAWAVVLVRDGLVLELWSSFRLSIRHDGADPMSGTPSAVDVPVRGNGIVASGRWDVTPHIFHREAR
ncbi:MAG: HNH endonuclease [Pseudomonadota bacterium]|nr:HNH endonuclease [Pseudomonadota bacterium]